MSEQQALTPDVHRILVAVDASPHSQAALEAAFELAARFEAELVVLFVEDINVLRTAQLPFVREVGLYSARGSRMDLARVERSLRARSRRVEVYVQSLMARRSVHGTFRIARGAVWAEIRTAAEEADLLMVGRAGWSHLRERRLGSTARAVCCSDRPSVTAVLHEGRRIAAPIVVVYDGSRLGDRALMLAATLAKRLEGPLRLILLVPDAAQIASLRKLAEGRLRPFDLALEFVPATLSAISGLTALLRPMTEGSLVLPARTSIFWDEAMLDLIEEIDVPVLVVH